MSDLIEWLDGLTVLGDSGDPHPKAKLVIAALEAKDRRIEELEARLELYDTDGERVPDDCDGIACRDETIKLLDEQRDKLLARVEQLEAELRKSLLREADLRQALGEKE